MSAITRLRLLRVILFTVLAVCRSAIASDGVTEETAAARFREEAPRAWSKLIEQTCLGVELAWTVRFGAPVNSGNAAGQSDVDPSIRGGEIGHRADILNTNEMVLTTQLFGPRKGSQRLEVVNDDYAFTLNRMSASDTWLLAGVDQHVGNVRQHGMMSAATPIFAGIMLDGAWLDQVVSSADFKIVSATVSGNESLTEECKLVFTSRYPIDARNTILGGTMWFASKNWWVLNRYEIDEQSADLGKVEAEFEYQQLGKLPLPKRFATTYRFPNVTRYVYHFNPVKKFQGSASQFRLSAFGLPEPSIVAGTEGFSYWIWINVLALILLVVAVVLRSYSMRKTA